MGNVSQRHHNNHPPGIKAKAKKPGNEKVACIAKPFGCHWTGKLKKQKRHHGCCGLAKQVLEAKASSTTSE